MSQTIARRKTQLTPEQLAAAKERRDTINRLAKTIGKLSDEERMTMASHMPVVTCEGHSLSPYNACLVVAQQPDATIVGGFQQWKKAGRQVKKGGKACGIFVPKYPKDDDGSSPVVVDERRFIMVNVFDVAMTEASGESE